MSASESTTKVLVFYVHTGNRFPKCVVIQERGGSSDGHNKGSVALPNPMHMPATEPPSLPIDPVCGMEVDPATDLHTDYKGTTYFFCHPSCLERFTGDPESFLHPREPEPVVPGAIYTCPMHPEVRQVGPGSCPICGMALEPERVTLDEGPNVELIDMTRRFYTAAILGSPVMVLAMIGMVAPEFVHHISGWMN